ncbi:MAG TPA: alpha/beta hydrolase [Thermomicrobiales bacterium]|nr:alpha/beta hydrolase [Thermomicrobiales bacterium]
MLATVNGIKLFFDVEGMGLAPSGPGMIAKESCFVLHGGPGMDHSYFKPWLSPLAETMQLIYVDHRGTGRSERVPLESCTIEQMADDLEALRELLGLERVNVLGNSFGGFWALTYALRYPDSVARLILVTTSPSYAFWEAAQAEADRKATPQQKAVMPDVFEGRIESEDEFRGWWEIMMPLYFYKWDDTIGGEMIARGVDSPQVASYMFREIIPHYDVRPRLGEISAPTLIAAGRHDWVTPVGESEAMARGIPNSEYVVFEKSGHMPFIEEQERFNDLVKRFVTTPA